MRQLKIIPLIILGLSVIFFVVITGSPSNFRFTSQEPAKASALYYTQLEQKIADNSLPKADYIVGGTAEDTVLQSFSHYGLKTRPVIEDVTGKDFTQSIRIETEKKPEVYNASWRFENPKPVNKGDVLLAVINIKVDDPSQGEVLMRYELTEGSHTSSFNRSIFLGNTWQTLSFTFKAIQDYPADKSRFLLHLGQQKQTVSIGGVALLNFGASVDLSDLEVLKTKVTYSGRELDSSWRKAAQERIEQNRKADMQFQIVDSLGQPVSCARVAVRMQRHKYGFGSAVWLRSDPEDQKDTDNQIYRQKVEELFNYITVTKYWFNENRNQKNILYTLAWADERGIKARGHTLIWPTWQYMPKDLRNHQNNPAYLRRNAREWIINTLTGLKGRYVDWDVINEPNKSRDLMNILGDDVMKEWLILAKNTDSNAKAFVNEIGVIENRVFASPAYNNLVRLIQSWMSNNVPIEGVGMQGHFDEGNLTDPEVLLKIFDGLATYNLDLQITEYDLKTTDEQLKADYTRDIMTVAFSHPSTSAFMMWGFWDGAHWKDDAPLFYKDWTLKPAGKVWLDLVHKEWWTDEQGQVDNDGDYRTRGFLGDYRITVNAGTLSRTFDVFLDSTGVNANLELPVEAYQICSQN